MCRGLITRVLCLAKNRNVWVGGEYKKRDNEDMGIKQAMLTVLR